MAAVGQSDRWVQLFCDRPRGPMRSEQKGFSHRPRTVWARRHCCRSPHKRARAKPSVYTEILRSQLTWALHIEGGFLSMESSIQDREPLAEVKRPAGGERRGSRPSMGRRKSSSTCLATSMLSSRSKSPSWSRTGSGLEKSRMLEKLAGLMAPNPQRESSDCSSQGLGSLEDMTRGSLAETPTRLSWGR